MQPNQYIYNGNILQLLTQNKTNWLAGILSPSTAYVSLALVTDAMHSNKEIPSSWSQLVSKITFESLGGASLFF